MAELYTNDGYENDDYLEFLMNKDQPMQSSFDLELADCEEFHHDDAAADMKLFVPDTTVEKNESSVLESINDDAQKVIAEALHGPSLSLLDRHEEPVMPKAASRKPGRRKQILALKDDLTIQPVKKPSAKPRAPKKVCRMYLYMLDEEAETSEARKQQIRKAKQIHRYHENQKARIVQLEQENLLLKVENARLRRLAAQK